MKLGSAEKSITLSGRVDTSAAKADRGCELSDVSSDTAAPCK